MAAVALAFVGEAVGTSLIGGTMGGIIGGALGGGLGSAASGGDFWSGALTGGLGSALGGAGGFLGEGGAVANALGGGMVGNMAASALRGGLTSSITGGNFLEGALTGAVMPSVISGAKNVLSGWSGASPTTGSWSGQQQSILDAQASGMPSWSAPAGASQQAMLDAQISGMDLPAPTWGVSTPAASPAGAWMDKMLKSDNMVPTLLNSGMNYMMQSKADKLAKEMAGRADPYASYRGGDAASYNALLKDPSSIYSDPAYQEMAKRAREAVMRKAAQTGNLDNPGLYQALQDNEAMIAQQFWQNRLGQFGTGAGVGQAPASGVQAASPFYTNNYLYAALKNPFQAVARTAV